MEISAYHPFRSEKAKAEYLTYYDMKAKEWPVVSETIMVGTSFGQTHIRISGPVDTQALVMLPGMGANLLMWLPNIEALSASYRTYAVDNIYDYGRSIYTRTIKDPEDFLYWLDELFNSLDLEGETNLVGMSYGAWLTSLYAIHFPDRLDKIVLLAPAATILPVRLGFYVNLTLSLLPMCYFAKRMVYWGAKDLINKNKKMVEDIVDHSLLARRCFMPKRVIAPTVLSDKELRSIRIPTLYLVGTNEKLYSALKAVKRLNKVVPQIRTEVIPNAGHDFAVVQAEMVNKKVLEFLK
jgi:pimeloyl-ACP methyl ester carboxylesterase